MARAPYIYAPEGVVNQEVIITGSEAIHLRSVLRLRRGELFTAFDGKGRGWICAIQSFEAGHIRGEVQEVLPLEPAPALNLTAAVAVVKGPRYDWAVEKAAELGAERFIPLLTRRGVVTPHHGRLQRWQTIAVAAAKQSQSRTLMQIMRPLNVQELVNYTKENGRLCALENLYPDYAVSDYAATLIPRTQLTLAVGPEGGWTAEELDIFRLGSAALVSLGDHPLRTETALLVTAGYLMLAAGSKQN